MTSTRRRKRERRACHRNPGVHRNPTVIRVIRNPEAPGLGVEVDEAACSRHPFAPKVMHTQNAVLDDGTIVDW